MRCKFEYNGDLVCSASYLLMFELIRHTYLYKLKGIKNIHLFME